MWSKHNQTEEEFWELVAQITEEDKGLLERLAQS